jgi:hypothetical protein
MYNVRGFMIPIRNTGDGLRADLLFGVNAFPSVPDAPAIVAPYLRSIVETRGAFGVSHTRVPTESRPGHVALIGRSFLSMFVVSIVLLKWYGVMVQVACMKMYPL